MPWLYQGLHSGVEGTDKMSGVTRWKLVSVALGSAPGKFWQVFKSVDLKIQEQPSHVSRVVGPKDKVVILPPLLTTRKLSESRRHHWNGEPQS